MIKPIRTVSCSLIISRRHLTTVAQGKNAGAAGTNGRHFEGCIDLCEVYLCRDRNGVGFIVLATPRVRLRKAR